MNATLIGTTLSALATGSVAGAALAMAQNARRVAAEASTRVTQLAAGRPVLSPRCTTPLQRALKAHEGQTHYCPRCSLWMVVAGA